MLICITFQVERSCSVKWHEYLSVKYKQHTIAGHELVFEGKHLLQQRTYMRLQQAYTEMEMNTFIIKHTRYMKTYITITWMLYHKCL